MTGVGLAAAAAVGCTSHHLFLKDHNRKQGQTMPSDPLNFSFYQDRSCLVTGAGGFIGSHLAEALARMGAKVRVLVHYNALGSIGNLALGDPRLVERMEIIRGDIADPFFISSAVDGMDTVFHLAALIGIPYSYSAPAQYVSTNVIGTLNVLEACRKGQPRRLVHTSTSETYGTARSVPIDEDHPLQAQSPYSATKIAADKLVESYFMSFGTPVTIVRPFNTFGPRQSARAIIPTIISQALTRNEIHVGSLDPVRDFNYVDNTVDGFLTMGRHEAALGEVVNVGSGTCIAIGEVVELVQSILGTNLPVRTDSIRVRPGKSEVMQLHCNFTKAKTLCDWTPNVEFKQGLELVIQWIRENIDKFTPDSYCV